MADLKYAPVKHNQAEFLRKAHARKGFTEAYDALALDYEIVSQMLAARARTGLTQDAVAERMGTTKSAISRLESGIKHAPSIATLKRYADALGYTVQVRLVPHKNVARTVAKTKPAARSRIAA
jgi:DNA-binding XRE family transcriptional regulator